MTAQFGHTVSIHFELHNWMQLEQHTNLNSHKSLNNQIIPLIQQKPMKIRLIKWR